jgi:hypothetical protein
MWPQRRSINVHILTQVTGTKVQILTHLEGRSTQAAEAAACGLRGGVQTYTYWRTLLVHKYKYWRIERGQALERLKQLHAASEDELKSEVLSLLALLVQKYRYWLPAPLRSRRTSTQFTCFTGTKVQILTTCSSQIKAHQYSVYLLYWYKSTDTDYVLPSDQGAPVLSLLALLVQKYRYWLRAPLRSRRTSIASGPIRTHWCRSVAGYTGTKVNGFYWVQKYKY